MKKLIGCFLIILFYTTCLTAQKTHIYIVRHAEKDLTDPNNSNPNLSPEGLIRAENLAEELKRVRISAVYSTNYNRTIQTATPTAEKNRVEITEYQPTEYSLLVDDILNYYNNQRILVVGHSDTILEIVESFGGERPIPEVLENEYSHFIHLVISDDGTRVFYKQY